MYAHLYPAYHSMLRKVQDFHITPIPFQHHPGQLIARADQVLLGMGAPEDRAAGMDLRGNRHNTGHTAGTRVVLWQHQKRHVVCPDKFHQHQRRLDRTAFRCGNRDNIAGHHALAEFILRCFYAQGEFLCGCPDKEE